MLSTIEAEALDILFIEDDPDIAEMYRLKLELDGYWVRVVEPDVAVAAARATSGRLFGGGSRLPDPRSQGRRRV